MTKTVTTRITAIGAAKAMAKERGYVVIGFQPFTAVRIGESTRFFAGRILQHHRLAIESQTDRSDWDAQVLAIYGDAGMDKNPIEEGQTFFRCRLVEDK